MNPIRKTISWGLLGSAVLTWMLAQPALVGAQPMTLQFTVPQGIWDVTGNYSGDEFDVTNNISLAQDDKGKITGTGTASGSDSGIDVELAYVVRGSIKTINDLTRLLLNVKVSGTATDGIVTLPVRGNIKFSLDLDKADQLLIGTGDASLCVKGRCAKASAPVQFDIPQPMNGDWTLVLDLQGIDRRIFGTATATLSNGRTLPFTLKGQYYSNPRSPSRINLKGSAGNITLEEPQYALAFYLTKGKLLGQSIPTSP